MGKGTRDDLIDGFYFYEKQEPGLCDYFPASLYPDMEALKIFFGIHPKVYRGFHTDVPLQMDFPRAETPWLWHPCQ